MSTTDSTGTTRSAADAGRREAADSEGHAAPADATRPGRSIGTVGVGLLVLLGVAVLAVGVIPQPRWDLWLVGVVAVLGLSLALLVLALLPRGHGRAAVVDR